MKYKIVILLVLTLFLGFLVDRLLIKYTAISYNNVPGPANSACVENNDGDKAEYANITYKTFSSPKADFAFEYPSTWVYDEKIDPENPNITGWNFYIDPNDKTEIPIFAVVSPMTEWVDFCSGGRSSIPNALASVNIYKTNDPETYVTYEKCGYIYWQKGKKIFNADDIKDIHQVNLIKFYFNPDFPAENNIAQHIVQSIKIK